MITDDEFWLETRRKVGGGNEIFKGMLALIHARQCALDSCTVTTDREEYNIASLGRKRRDEVIGRVYTPEERREHDEERRRAERELKELERPLEQNKVFAVGHAAVKDSPRRVSSSTIRVLQQVMMFAVPIYALRYNVPAMSMSWNTSCFIDRPSKQLITFGAGNGVKVPQFLCGRGCVAGEGFFSILTDQDEVWCSGGLKVSSSSSAGPTPLCREDAMAGIAGNTLMLAGHGQRLAIVTRAFTVRPLSALSTNTRSIIPSRHVRFLDLGYGEDFYMVGTDSIVYKTTASKRAVSTPRRVMTLCRTPASRVASGTGFLLIIDQNGHLYSFGRNKKGQLGNGEQEDARRKPIFQDALRHHFFVQVAAGDCHSLALTSSGVVYGAGSNESGQLGLGQNVKQVCRFTPIPLGGEEMRCIGIAAGPAGSMFYCDDGQVLTCGLNDNLQLGLDTSAKIVYQPTPVSALTEGVESYTMDFGGFRRPETSEQAASAAQHDGEAGGGPNSAGQGSGADAGGAGTEPPVVIELGTPQTTVSKKHWKEDHEPMEPGVTTPLHPAVERKSAGGAAAKNNRRPSGPAAKEKEKEKAKCGACCTMM